MSDTFGLIALAKANANSAQISQLTDYAHGKLLASVTVEAPVYPGTDITIDTDEDTLVVDGYAPVAGDRVAFYATSVELTDLPTGIQAGFPYFVINPTEGGVFQISTTSDGSAVDITSTGVPANYQMEKQSINEIKIQNLNLTQCRIVSRGAFSGENNGVGRNHLAMYINGLGLGGDSYFMPGPSNDVSSLRSNLSLFYDSGVSPIHGFSVMDITLQNNRLYMVQSGYMYGASNSSITEITRKNPREPSSSSLEDPIFESLTEIRLLIASGTGYFGNGFTVEVYNG
jgi:hypothetical protein